MAADPLTPDQWIAALGGLPLLDQPGERWRYNTGATVAGILIERVAGLPLAEVLSKRVFEPLGMTDTAFYVPPAEMGRFTSMYAPTEVAAVFGASPDAAGAGSRWSTGRTAGTPRRPRCPTARPGWSPPSMTWRRSPPCWPTAAAACCRPSRSR